MVIYRLISVFIVSTIFYVSLLPRQGETPFYQHNGTINLQGFFDKFTVFNLKLYYRRSLLNNEQLLVPYSNGYKMSRNFRIAIFQLIIQVMKLNIFGIIHLKCVKRSRVDCKLTVRWAQTTDPTVQSQRTNSSSLSNGC